MRFKHVLVALVVLAASANLASWRYALSFPEDSPPDRVAGTPVTIPELRPGWRLTMAAELPESIDTLHAIPGSGTGFHGLVYAGTSGAGGVYRINPATCAEPQGLAIAVGDVSKYGTCSVNRLGLHDLDGDGELELIAGASQITPAGRPKVGVWSSNLHAASLRAMARPAIQSHWSHALGFLPREGRGSLPSLFVTYCGHGEIVEYRMEPKHTGDGFRNETLSWKLVGQLPASGEWLQVADADNDGTLDVCVATGFALGKAAILLYHSEGPGSNLAEVRRIDENGRFGNVRFLVGEPGRDGVREILAWWCSDIGGGASEVIVYRLDGDGIRERKVLATGPSSAYWADDNRFTNADLDGDGHHEFWFTTAVGDLYRYAPNLAPGLERIAHFDVPANPLAFGVSYVERQPRLYLGQGKRVLVLEHLPSPRP